MNGRIRSVNMSKKTGTPKQPVDQAQCLPGHGLKDDAHAGAGHRQICLVASESYQKLEKRLNRTLPAGELAENITTEGLILHTLKVGTQLKIGPTLHRISQIGKTCHHGCAIKQTVGECIVPTEGIFTEVLHGGVIQAGDSITVVPN